MASYRQNAAQVVNPAPYHNEGQTRSRAIYRPQMLTPSMENPSQWTPFGTWQPHPYWGGWDGLGGRLMHVAQADLYDVSPNPWPANQVLDQPGAAIAAVNGLLRLQPTTSAHPGLSMPAPLASPTMLFSPPPPGGQQTTPIYALGV